MTAPVPTGPLLPHSPLKGLQLPTSIFLLTCTSSEHPPSLFSRKSPLYPGNNGHRFLLSLFRALPGRHIYSPIPPPHSGPFTPVRTRRLPVPRTRVPPLSSFGIWAPEKRGHQIHCFLISPQHPALFLLGFAKSRKKCAYVTEYRKKVEPRS